MITRDEIDGAIEDMCAFGREHVKETTMGSYESAKRIATCYHNWKPRPAILFGYLHVDAQCIECKTWWAPT